jgi:hypothetical protein
MNYPAASFGEYGLERFISSPFKREVRRGMG